MNDWKPKPRRYERFDGLTSGRADGKRRLLAYKRRARCVDP